MPTSTQAPAMVPAFALLHITSTTTARTARGTKGHT
jgi:hypothetical protein